MRIVSLNTWKNEGRYRRRLDLMAEGLAALRADLVCLQECFVGGGADTAAHLAERLGLDLTWTPARRKLRRQEDGWVESVSGMAMLSRQALLAEGRIILPTDERDGERIAQWGQAAPDLVVANLHLTHLRGPDAARLRELQLRTVLEQAPPLGALLILGDFNAEAAAPELAAIAEALDLNAPPTLQGERAGSPSAAVRTLDHAGLVRPGGWRISARTRALDAPCPEGWFPSDHAAVVVDLVRA
ncbi:endonuclease/exonuclease/phosphatase family protein [Phenylobacterium sp.]|uniref:endonuclease/exonuclease/phosphatase family protein n=1 Tax=Phenylobacterium sp. TaxID=1871053 RepID=UPI002FD9D973